MTTPTLDPTARRFIAHLQRGGTKSNWWAAGSTKQTIWWDSAAPAALLNGHHNMYFGVHPCSTIPPTNAEGKPCPPRHVRSQAEYIAAINCLFAEFDAKHFAGGKAAALAHIEALDPAPSVVVDSGGGYHVYWLFAQPFMLDTDAARARADHAQKGWVKRVRSDDGAKDLARVLRVPGTHNFKPEYAPDYPEVRFIRADFERLYTFEALAARVPAAAPPKAREPRHKPIATATLPGGDTDADFDDIAEAARNLKRLAPWRRDQYQPWINVGMALYELGSIGYCLWEKWSKLSGAYRPGDCEKHWPTFNPDTTGDPIRLASLAYWAREDDPQHAPAVPEQVQQQLEEYKQEEVRRLKILRNEALGDREKVAWLAMRNTVDVRLALRPEGSIRLSGEDVGHVMGKSASTGNRTIRTLEQHGVLVCDPAPVITPDGLELQQMRVLPGPAFDRPELVKPAEKKQRGGARPGAGRKPKCATCPEGTTILKRTTVTHEYFCAGCGEKVAEEQRVGKATVLDPEINFDFAEQAVEEQASGPIGPEINFDFAESPATPEPACKTAPVDTISLFACNSASGSTDNIGFDRGLEHHGTPRQSPGPVEQIEIIGHDTGPAPPLTFDRASLFERLKQRLPAAGGAP